MTDAERAEIQARIKIVQGWIDAETDVDMRKFYAQVYLRIQRPILLEVGDRERAEQRRAKT